MSSAPFTPHVDERPRTDVTAPQLDFVRSLQRQLHLSDRLLDAHCEATFGRPFDCLTRLECSQLIDEMKGWTAIPAELLREAGQLDLFGGAR